MDRFDNENDDIQEEEDDYYLYSHIANIMTNNIFVDDPDPDLDPVPEAEEDIDENEYIMDSPEYHDLREIFRIHTSNAIAYSSNEIPDRYLLHDNGIFTNTVRSYFNNHSCPICDLNDLSTEQLGSHLIYNHSRLFVSLTSTLYPNLTAQDIQNVLLNVQPPSSYLSNLYDTERDDNMRQVMYRLLFNDDTDDSPTYEDLLNLCEYIGYHKQGILDIEKVTTVITDQESVKKDDTCIICLELLSSKENIRKINICSHMFCHECIEKWCEENKSCPLCKKELDGIDI